jgi:hypothetical protein
MAAKPLSFLTIRFRGDHAGFVAAFRALDAAPEAARESAFEGKPDVTGA